MREFTKSVQSSGPENIGPERTLPGLLALTSVNSSSRITLENNGKTLPQPDRETLFAGVVGGGSGIRTHDTGTRIHAFQACAFSLSAIPRGRPKKPKPRKLKLSDTLSDSFWSEEAYRTVTLRENGETIELPIIQAVMRSLFLDGLKGKRLSQKLALELTAKKEELDARLAAERYARLESLKRKGQEVLMDYQRRGLPPPPLRPHPDDIVLVPETLEAYVNGPETPEDELIYDFSLKLRDHLVLKSVLADKTGVNCTVECNGKSGCGYLILARLINRSLPNRYRWQDGDQISLMMDLYDLSVRECKRRVAKEMADLLRTRPEPNRITPEVREDLDRFSKTFAAM